jgi:hypothetical protein
MPLNVSVSVSPGEGIQAYAVEEAFPAGWAVVQVGANGEFDMVNGKVKWGPFTDNQVRVLCYAVSPPPSATGTALLSGVVSFDGRSAATAGSGQVQEGCQVICRLTSQGIQMSLVGRVGASFLVESSTDLKNWVTVGIFTNTVGQIDFSDPAGGEETQRFYRASRIE